MNRLELEERISKGENIHTEFKESIENKEDLAKAIVCFANTDGGQIIVGVSDSGDIRGVQNIDEFIRFVDDVAFNRCEPPITVIQETISIDDKTIIVINVPKGEQRPYRTSSGIHYVRSSNKCRQASREELLRLFQSADSVFYDELEIHKASIKDIDTEYFKLFVSNYFGIKVNNRTVRNYLKNLKILSLNDKPTVGGILFFGNNPQTFIPHSKIIVGYFKYDSISDPPLDKKDITGKLPEILEDSMKFLRLYLREEHRIKGLEKENYLEIPEVALREALVNSIAHRDYTISASTRIFVFRNRVEFRSPGKLPNTVTIESIKIGGSHVLRNPTIYNLFAKMGFVTDIGSGILRIMESVKDSIRKKVKIEVIENEFVLTIPRKRR